MGQESNISRYSTHPIVLIAAIAVVLFCGIGIAAIMGWLPKSGASMGPAIAEAPVQVGMADLGPPAPPAGYAAADSAGHAGGGSYGSGAGVAAAPAPAPAPRQAVERAAPPAPVCRSCGVIESVRTITKRGEGSGVGAAGGALVGGLLGNQIGDGHGRQLATVAGAVGGAVVGNQVEGNMKATRHYEVKVRMDDGKLRTVGSSAASWQAGDHVKIVKGRLQRR